MSRLSTAQNLFDFFHDEVGAAVKRQRVSVSEDGVYYLANLLVEQSHTEAEPDTTLAELHMQARAANGTQAFQAYRQLGDKALVVSGFFRESLSRRAVGLRYYKDMGAQAYGVLSRLGRVGGQEGGLDQVFGELAEGFEGCSEALCEVKDELTTRTEQDIVKLYEEWLATGSERIAERLRELGVLPIKGADVED